jgi:hypothetical protein
MIGARLDFLARMAGHQGAISLVADDEVPCPLLKSTSEFCPVCVSIRSPSLSNSTPM